MSSDEQIVAVALCDRGFEGQFAPRHLQTLNEIGRSHEQHAPVAFNKRQPDRRRQVALSPARPNSSRRASVVSQTSPDASAIICAFDPIGTLSK